MTEESKWLFGAGTAVTIGGIAMLLQDRDWSSHARNLASIEIVSTESSAPPEPPLPPAGGVTVRGTPAAGRPSLSLRPRTASVLGAAAAAALDGGRLGAGNGTAVASPGVPSAAASGSPRKLPL